MEDYLTILTTAIALAAAIAAVTPTESDNKVINIILRIVNLLGLNVGKAKNKDDTLTSIINLFRKN